MNKKVIVFGATGTLGAHITTHLQQKGYQVYAVGHRKSKQIPSEAAAHP